MLLLLFMLITFTTEVHSALLIRRQQQQQQPELISTNTTNSNHTYLNYIYNGTVTQNFNNNQSQQYPVQTVFGSSNLERTVVSNLLVLHLPRYCLSLCDKNMTYCTNSIMNNTNIVSSSLPSFIEEDDFQSIALVLDVIDTIQEQPICSLEEKLNNIRRLNEILLPSKMHVKFIILEHVWGAQYLDIDTSSISLPANLSLILASNDTINDIVGTVKSHTNVNYTESQSPYILDESSHKWNLTLSLTIDLLINRSTDSIPVTNTTTDDPAVTNTSIESTTITSTTTGSTTTESTQTQNENISARVFLTSSIIIFIGILVTVCLVYKNSKHERTESLSPFQQDILRRETERQIQLLKKKYKNRLTEMEFNTIPIRQYNHDLYNQIHGIKHCTNDHTVSNIVNTTTIDKEVKLSICDEIEKSTQSGSAAVLGRELSIRSAPNLNHYNTGSVDRTTNNTDSNSCITSSRRNMFHRMMSLDLKLFQSKDECTSSSIHNKKDIDEKVTNNKTDVEEHSNYCIDSEIDPNESSDDDYDDEGSCCGKCRQDHDDGDDVCSICIEEFVNGENVIVLPSCNHIFHKDCIQLWLLKKRGTCPMCKVIVLNEQQIKEREQRIILIATERAMELCQRL